MRMPAFRQAIMLFSLMAFFFATARGLEGQKKSIAFEKTFGGPDEDEALSVHVKKNGGYVAAGYTCSKGKGEADGWLIHLTEKGGVVWERTYGSAEDERFLDVRQTAEGGYILAGQVYTGGEKGYDAWIVKTGPRGETAWEKFFGRTGNDIARSVRQTRDGGYIFAGSTEALAENSTDIWIVKLDKNGAFQWEKLFGGKSYDEAYCIQETMEGGYVLCGSTQSRGEGGFDLWVMKLNQTGALIWEKVLGGAYTDEGRFIRQTPDSGYIIAGYNDSKTGGYRDAWLLKLDALGSLKWENNFGGINVDLFTCVEETEDGCYLACGSNSSSGSGMNDLWLARIDQQGRMVRENFYGGREEEGASSLALTADGGCIIAGFTESKGGGGKDAWVLKLERDVPIK